MTDREASRFVNKLRRDYPIQVPVKVAVSLEDRVERGLDKLYGTVHKPAGSDRVTIRVVSGRSDSLVYKTIAHEYRHIMQWFNEDLEPLKTRSGRTNKEIDAQLFGEVILKSYLGF